MRIQVIDITWQSATKALPTRMAVEVEDDTPAEDLPSQIKYALWRATGITPVSWKLAKGPQRPHSHGDSI